MISDDDMREVAAKLRWLASKQGTYKGVLVSDVLAQLRLLSVDHQGFMPRKSVARLADLIDRPTCRLDLTDVEAHGNAKVRIYECSRCGRSCEEIYGEYERCPHCGARMVRDGD